MSASIEVYVSTTVEDEIDLENLCGSHITITNGQLSGSVEVTVDVDDHYYVDVDEDQIVGALEEMYDHLEFVYDFIFENNYDAEMFKHLFGARSGEPNIPEEDQLDVVDNFIGALNPAALARVIELVTPVEA